MGKIENSGDVFYGMQGIVGRYQVGTLDHLTSMNTNVGLK